MGNGKGSEHWVEDQLRSRYGLEVDINRLPDKFDTGNYEDIRPSDFILVFSAECAQNELKSKTNTVYCEVKESEAKTISFAFSTLRKGQKQGMARAIRLRVNYFVVYRNILHNVTYLIPAVPIVAAQQEGMKSMNADALEPYKVETLKLYNVFGETHANRSERVGGRLHSSQS